MFKKSEYSSTLVVKIIIKKKGGEDQDTKTSLIDDVYLQFCHVIFFKYALCISLFIYRSSGASKTWLRLCVILLYILYFIAEWFSSLQFFDSLAPLGVPFTLLAMVHKLINSHVELLLNAFDKFLVAAFPAIRCLPFDRPIFLPANALGLIGGPIYA